VLGAAAGAFAVVLFVAGGLLVGERPGFDAGGSEVAVYLGEHRTQVQVGTALDASVAPFFVWFLATVASLARSVGPAARRAAGVAYGCGIVFVALFLADLTALAVSALRPESMFAVPEIATALRDFEFLAMGVAAPAVVGMLAGFAVLVLRHDALWPRWVGWLAIVAAPAYALRVGTLFAVDGAFAADGALGLVVPVIGLASWLFVASVVLTVRLRRHP
jgi:hypothetical protein